MSAPRFVEYGRVSTDDQVRSATVENQHQAFDCLAATRPGIPAEPCRFEDLGVSGAVHLEDRPGWSALERVLRKGDVQEVRVYDMTRLTRDDGLTDCERLVRLMRELDLCIVTSEGEEIRATTSMDLLMLVIRALGAADERKRIMKRTIAGKLRNLREGRPGAGRRSVGLLWDKKTKTFSIDPQWSEVIPRIFQLCIDGYSLRSICEILNAENIAAPRSARWRSSQLGKMLRYPVYKGELRQQQNGEEHLLKDVPAIVDERTWERAQEALRCRAHVPVRAAYAVPALVRNLAHCALCGRRMRVRAGREGLSLPVERRSSCTRYHCPWCRGLPYHRADKVDEQVWAVVRRSLFDAEGLLEAAIDSHLDIEIAPEREIIEVQRDLDRIRRKTKQFSAQFAADRLTEKDYEDALSMLKEQRENATRRLVRVSEALAAAEQARARQATLAESILLLRARLDDADYATRREIVEAVVPFGVGKVILWPDRRIEIRGVLPVVQEVSPNSPSRRSPACSR